MTEPQPTEYGCCSYRGGTIHPDHGIYYWFGYDHDVDSVGDPLQYVNLGGHGEADTIKQCASDMDDYIVDDASDFIKKQFLKLLKRYVDDDILTQEERKECFEWAIEQLKGEL